ncbi:iron-containing alcohol dehydrogenase [Cellulomonas sp. PhB143]|uniref:iron-containing alcohol dehydrogenase n=1 Tax=Cellulomonas sp. PhB143 TaxID=2485186 RepID=UPI0013156003|nr:iron-containing alcohol dehydrogenase [Cellulomonas sp. PhB143]
MPWAIGQHAGDRPVVILDHAVAVTARERFSVDAVAEVVVRAAVGWDEVRRITRLVREKGADSIIVVGGGNAIDAAKLASACAPQEHLLELLLARARLGGLCAIPEQLWSPMPVVCAPTTFGTGAEVSAVACCELSEGGGAAYKCLVGMPSSPVVAAAYEPSMLVAPRPLVLAGAAESWTRVLGAAIASDSRIGWANDEARHLVARTGQVAAAALRAGSPSEDTLVSWALASASSHLGWALRGRGVAPFPLWFVANELSMELGVTKMEALSALWPGWVGAVLEGRDEWGDRARMDEMLEISGVCGVVDLVDRVRALVPARRARAALAQGSDVADVVAARVVARFGNRRPLSRRFTRESVGAVLRGAARRTDEVAA